MPGVVDGDLQIGALLIALKAKQILPKHHLDGMYGGLVLGQLGIEVGFEGVAILLCE